MWLPSNDTSASVNGLVSGTHVVIVSDANNCSANDTVILNQPPQLVINTSSTDAGCGQSNGTAIAHVTGGSPGYLYSWNTNPVQTDSVATGLSGGTYTATITDTNGCVETALAAVSNISTLVVTIDSVIEVACSGGATGSAYVSVSGGVPGYTYNWVPSGGTGSIATGLTAGMYAFNVTDSAGCISAALVTINEPLQLGADAGPDVALCTGDTAIAGNAAGAAGGTAPFIYSWSPAASIISPGDSVTRIFSLNGGQFVLTVTDVNNCVSIDTMELVVHPLPPVPVITQNFDTLFSVPASGYQWFSGIQILQGDTNEYYKAFQNGTYSVIITDSNGCSRQSLPYFYGSTGTVNNTASDYWKVFPNPVTANAVINFSLKSESFVSINIYSGNGDKIASVVNEKRPAGMQSVLLNAREAGCSRGLYILECKTNEQLIHLKIIVQ